VTEREAPPEWGFDYRQDDPYEDDGWFGREQVAEPAPVQQVAEPAPVQQVAEPAPVQHVAEPAPVQQIPDPPPAQPVINVPEEPYEAPRDVGPAPAPPSRRTHSSTVSTWTVNGQLRASSNSSLTFRSPPPPWYRSKQARIALIAVASAAVAVPIVLLTFRAAPSTSPVQSTSVAPRPSMSTQPAPSSAPTPINNVPPPLPPPPPPPPPPAAEDTGSDPQPYWTRPAAPPPAEKPDVGVTRTPVTRAPISVAPVPRQSPDNNSATPGDGRRRGCAGWC
jgi:hypothetical protein